MAEKEYQYPDRKDEITAENIKKIELYPGYWEESEKNVLNIAKKLIKTNAGYERFLDAGCGEGRLIPVFEGQFEEIVAIDPDQERLTMAEELIRDRGLAKKTTLKNAGIEEFEDRNKFDFILCSHVLQHVHTDVVPIIIKKLRNLIKVDGLLCITTCHSVKSRDYFAKELLRNSELLKEPIYEGEFNSLINSKGILPVHFFAFGEIRKLLDNNGFKIIEFRVFHLDKMAAGHISNERIDEVVNLDPELMEANGLDIMIAAVPIRKGGE
jgi:2-polyprenyl-3-methyl-5-hydroxy-6-metoxy-1,4-benzoquinol methylase